MTALASGEFVGLFFGEQSTWASEFPKLLEETAKLINSANKTIRVETNGPQSFDFHVASEDSAWPYRLFQHHALLNEDFYHTAHITADPCNFLAYCIGLALIERRCRLVLDNDLSIYRSEFRNELNSYIWNGGLPWTATASVEELQKRGEEQSAYVSAVFNIISLPRGATSKLRLPAQQFAIHLSQQYGIRLNVEDLIRILTSLPQDIVPDVNRAVASNSPDALHKLVTLLSFSPLRESRDLLKSLGEHSKTPERLRTLVQQYLETVPVEIPSDTPTDMQNAVVIRLYEEKDTDAGREISEFVNNLTRRVKLQYAGQVPLTWQGTAPYTVESVTGLPDVLANVYDLAVVLTNQRMRSSCSVRNRYAIISAGGFLNRMHLSKSRFFGYHIAVAILSLLYKAFTRQAAPPFPNLGPGKIRGMILEGRLPRGLTEAMSKAASASPDLADLVADIRSLVRSVSDTAETQSEVTHNTVAGKDVVTERITDGSFYAVADGLPLSDALDYSEYASALVDVITHRNTQTPLTIGVFGPWGIGKTSLMDMVRKQILGENNSANSQNRPYVVQINAWEFAKTEKVWIEFYSRILNALVSGLSHPSRIAFKARFRWKQSRKQVIIYLCLFAMSLTLAIVAVFRRDWITLAVDWVVRSYALVIGIGLTASIVLSFLGNVSRNVFRKLRSITRWSIPGTQQEVLRDLELASQAYDFVAKKRVVVLVDDIDRCRSREILEILEAIKLFLNIPKTVFILAIDARVTCRAIAEHYGFISEDHGEKEEIGRSYLEKIIQIPFNLPPLSCDQKRNLSHQIIQPYLRNITITPQPLSVDGGTNIPTVEVGEGEDPPTDRSAREIERNEDKGPELTPDPEPESVSNGTLWLTSTEANIIQEIMQIRGYTASPRLIKRFVNVYLVARHLYLSQRAKASQKANQLGPPHRSFTEWIALTVLYPLESAALVRWLEHNDWLSPVDRVFSKAGHPLYDETRVNSTAFARLPVDRLSQFGSLYVQMGIDLQVVKGTLPITSCFNFVLD